MFQKNRITALAVICTLLSCTVILQAKADNSNDSESWLLSKNKTTYAFPVNVLICILIEKTTKFRAEMIE